MCLICETKFIFNFIYKSKFENGLTEHEFDHVYYGVSDDQPKPNPSEVSQWKYVTLDFLQKDILTNPANYTVWLSICLPKLVEYLNVSSADHLSQVSAR